MLHFFDYIFLLRPTLLAPVWVFFLLGFYRTRVLDMECSSLLLPGAKASFCTPKFAIAFILYSLLMGGVYILNQIIDRESDRINKKLFLLSEKYVPVSHAWIELIFLFIIAGALAIPFSMAFKVILLLSGIFGILYSAPPFKFKGRPFFDLFSNAFGYGVLAFLLGWVTLSPFSGKALLYALPYFFAVGGVFINTTIPDIKGDKETNEITTGVFLGERKAYWLATIFIFISLVISICLKDRLCGITALAASPLFLLAGIKQELKYCFISIRVGAPILAILVCIKFPWFLILLLLFFLGLRIYYKRRFGIVYPKVV